MPVIAEVKSTTGRERNTCCFFVGSENRKQHSFKRERNAVVNGEGLTSQAIVLNYDWWMTYGESSQFLLESLQAFWTHMTVNSLLFLCKQHVFHTFRGGLLVRGWKRCKSMTCHSQPSVFRNRIYGSNSTTTLHTHSLSGPRCPRRGNSRLWPRTWTGANHCRDLNSEKSLDRQ